VKNFIFGFVLFLICFSDSYAKTFTICDVIQRNDDRLYYKIFTNKPFTGFVDGPCIFRRFPENSVIKEEKTASTGKFKNGRKIGKWINYHKNGMVSDIENYKDGKYHGNTRRFDEWGNLRIDTNYNADKFHGLTIIYHESPSSLVTKVEYKNGKKWNGDVYWLQSKNDTFSRWSNYLQLKGTIKEGKLHGKLIEYDKLNNITNEEKWENGDLISENFINEKLKRFVRSHINN
tara:strand:+ start:341 stop:1036 length:696 start_codon:yes stop_codon:yes gene_type:complete